MKTKKRIISLFLVQITFSILFINLAKCQEIDFELTVDSSKVIEANKYIINVKIISGEKPYTIFLFKDDIRSKPIQKIENTKKGKIKFENLENGQYIIYVEDLRKHMKGKSYYFK